MNAIRTFATPDSSGKLTIQVPEAYRNQEVEVIVLYEKASPAFDLATSDEPLF